MFAFAETAAVVVAGTVVVVVAAAAAVVAAVPSGCYAVCQAIAASQPLSAIAQILFRYLSPLACSLQWPAPSNRPPFHCHWTFVFWPWADFHHPHLKVITSLFHSEIPWL